MSRSSTKDRVSMKDRLRMETGEAARRVAHSEHGLEVQESKIAAGDLFVLDGTPDTFLEWAILEVESGEPKIVRVVPADTLSMIGSGDVRTPDGQRSPLSLRCRFAASISSEIFSQRSRSGVVPEPSVVTAKEKLEQIEAGRTVGTAIQRQVDADPEYQTWAEEVLAPARQVLENEWAVARPTKPKLAKPAAEVVELRSKATRPSWSRRLQAPLALAASVLFVLSLGLGQEVWNLRNRHEALLSENQTITHEHRETMERLQNTAESLVHQDAEVARLEGLRSAQAEQIEALQRATESQQPVPPPARKKALVNLPFAVLTPGPSRGTDELLIEKAEMVLLILQVDVQETYPRFRLEVFSDQDRRRIWQSDKLTSSPTAELTVALPGELLLPGEYTLKLTGLIQGKAVPLPSYRLVLIDAR